LSETAIVLVGAGGHARACIDVIEQAGLYASAALVGMPEQVGSRVLGYPVVGTDADLGALRSRHAHALVVVGQIKTPEPRIRLFELLLSHGYTLPVIISPYAHVSRHATLGEGTIVMHGAVVNASAVVGRNCILNSQSLVEHDVVIGDHCHIATAAAINSGVRIEAASFVGSNSCVRQGIRIGERCVIGMGQRVLADCAAGAQLPGATARS
jgi:sugar O-acyltransferase (sialic acid O-acetyltransferase NeuD family)